MRGQKLNQQPLRDPWRSIGRIGSAGKRRSSGVLGSGPLVAIQRAVVASGRQETWCDELKRQQIRVRSSLLSIEIGAKPGTPTWTRLTESLKMRIPKIDQLVKLRFMESWKSRLKRSKRCP